MMLATGAYAKASATACGHSPLLRHSPTTGGRRWASFAI